MRRPGVELERYLDDLARGARAGERLPTIRELMKRFGASQVLVQRSFEALKSRGLIESHVGRGTFFRGPVEAVAAGRSASRAAVERGATSTLKSVLLLRRSISIARGRVLVEGLQKRFAAEGHRVLELSYTDPDHALTVLRGLPPFDAAMVQSTYRTIPVELLAALRQRCEVLAVDGLMLVGSDIEAVGTEWGEPLAQAVAQLAALGHQRIALAITSAPQLPAVLGRRRLVHLREQLPGLELQEITVPRLPDEDYAALLVERIRAAWHDGKTRFSALVAWGIEDGAAFRSRLAEIGIAIPSALSVVLLGRTDLENEHAGFFDVVGCSVADQVDGLHEAITGRWADPGRPYGVRLTPLRRREGASTAPPAHTGTRRTRR